MKREREKDEANMQKRPRETFRIPVKSRSALSECVLNKKSHKKVRIESKSPSENRLMWITSEVGQAKDEDDELNLIFIQFQV